VSDLITTGRQALAILTQMENAEKELLQHPQADCPVVHHFGPGVCIREVFMPAGTLAIGHRQKYEHLNLMLRGKVMVVNDDGSAQILTAPMVFVGKPGRKIGYVVEDMVWQNIYATDLKNADDVEAYFIEKSEDWQLDHKTKFAVEQTARVADKIDYFQMLEETGFDPELVRQQVENPHDQIWVDSAITRVSDSPIDGKGLFVTHPVKAGDVICAARVGGFRTQAGRFTNHSLHPNAKMVAKPNGDIDLVALVDFEGCKGGGIGVEATIDYRQALALSDIKVKKQESVCLV
jgi:hypothetical protein